MASGSRSTNTAAPAPNRLSPPLADRVSERPSEDPHPTYIDESSHAGVASLDGQQILQPEDPSAAFTASKTVDKGSSLLLTSTSAHNSWPIGLAYSPLEWLASDQDSAYYHGTSSAFSISAEDTADGSNPSYCPSIPLESILNPFPSLHCDESSRYWLSDFSIQEDPKSSNLGYYFCDSAAAPGTSETFLDTGVGRSSDSRQSIEQSQNISSETCTSDDGGSNLDAPLWFPPSFHGTSFMVASQSLRDLESSVVQAVIDAYLQSHGNSSGGSGDPSNKPSPSSNKQSEKKNNNKKRSLDSSQSSEETEQGGPAPKKRRTAICRQPGQLRLACPFQKKDPERYPQCGIREGGYQTIGHMKQHLRRSHERNPNYCPRCKYTFPSEDEKNAHIMEMVSNPCNESLLPLPDGLSPELLHSLSVRVDKGISMEEQWYSVWDLIFPGLARPATCRFDLTGDMAAQTLGLCTFLEREGPLILTSFLNERNIAVMETGFETPFNFDEAFQRRIISEAFRQIVTTWHRQRPRGEDREDSPRSLALPTPASTLEGRSPNEDGLDATLQREDKNPPSGGFEFESL